VFNEEKTTTKVYAEFKLEVPALVVDHGYSYKQTCESLDLTETALRGWVKPRL